MPRTVHQVNAYPVSSCTVRSAAASAGSMVCTRRSSPETGSVTTAPLQLTPGVRSPTVAATSRTLARERPVARTTGTPSCSRSAIAARVRGDTRWSGPAIVPSTSRTTAVVPDRSRFGSCTDLLVRWGQGSADARADPDQHREPLHHQRHRPDRGRRGVEVGVAAVVEHPGAHLAQQAGEQTADRPDQYRDHRVAAHDRQERDGAEAGDDRDVVGDGEADPEAQEQEGDSGHAEHQHMGGSREGWVVPREPYRHAGCEQPGEHAEDAQLTEALVVADPGDAVARRE